MEYHPVKDASRLFVDELLPIERRGKRKVHFYFYKVIVSLFCVDLSNFDWLNSYKLKNFWYINQLLFCRKINIAGFYPSPTVLYY